MRMIASLRAGPSLIAHQPAEPVQAPGPVRTWSWTASAADVKPPTLRLAVEATARGYEDLCDRAAGHDRVTTALLAARNAGDLVRRVA
ncbi:hypothetical protein Pme01_29200 [Planosporangium mesophilum]|uniref:Uncharacterized protein n=1 Tax=Planosporangium mesophilum TaxID=689768 RepID=A0A8J3TB68_9ACTN|nr:hypothetical protein Pme01_29200 [Planosporangium mesophilum]